MRLDEIKWEPMNDGDKWSSFTPAEKYGILAWVYYLDGEGYCPHPPTPRAAASCALTQEDDNGL